MDNNSDRDLIAFLSKTDATIIDTLIKFMKTLLQVDIDAIETDILTNGMPEANTVERNQLAEKLVFVLRYFGSHNIAYMIRDITSDEAGVHYSEICRDVCKDLNKQLKKKVNIPRVATVGDYERMVCEIILKIEFQGKSQDEIVQMLDEAGLDKDAIEQTAKELASFATAGASLIALVKILGKRTVTELIKRIIIIIVGKYLGEEAAKKLAQRILAKFAQKTFQKLIAGIGWVLLVKDIIDIMGPAKRITVPCVCLIASIRIAEEKNVLA